VAFVVAVLNSIPNFGIFSKATSTLAQRERFVLQSKHDNWKIFSGYLKDLFSAQLREVS
jgi:hypothetical protein